MFYVIFNTYTLWISIVLLLKNITSAQQVHAGMPQLRRVYGQEVYPLPNRQFILTYMKVCGARGRVFRRR